MRKGILSFSLLLLSFSAFAHRLNEYLQATTISLSPDKVSLELRLTPGVAVAGQLMKVIDLNHDGQFSAAEQTAYLATLQHDLSFTLDGQATKLQITSFSFPAAEAMTKGTGDIIVHFKAPINATTHQLQLTNHHYQSIAVYLVNCLLPADTGIHVTNQTRNANQSFYQLDFTTNHSTIKSALSANSDHWATVKTYELAGIRHILTGYDHLLFLCALVLGAAGLWDLVKIVTAFTIAHSITLTLATFGLAHLPENIVEPMIAASIVFVAAQNICWPKQANGNSRLAIAFFFGLFHGLGFAGGLLELMHAMSPSLIWFAILGFSLGVEAGNQLVLLPLYGGMQWLKKSKGNSVNLIFRRYASGAVAMGGLYYLLTDLIR